MSMSNMNSLTENVLGGESNGIYLRWVVCIVTVLFACSTSRGATWYVAPGGNDGNEGTNWKTAFLTIGAGVTAAAAANDDIVLVSNGTYTVSTAISVTKAITIRGLTGLRDTIVDGNYPTTSNRCFSVNNVAAVLDGLTIRNAWKDGDGAGVLLTKGTITDCTITGNEAKTLNRRGGGVSCANAGVISNCTITNNTANQGGGIFFSVGGIATDCTISENLAVNYGGGVSFYYGGTVSNCDIRANQVTKYYGGGVYSLGDARIGTVVDCTIANNVNNGAKGGGIYGKSVTVRNCVISNNVADTGGGGIQEQGTYVTLEHCTITGNVTGLGTGGGISAPTSTTRIRNCLISGNYSGGTAGGVDIGPAVMDSCTIVRNQAATSGGGLYGNHASGRVTNSIVYFNSDNGVSTYSNFYNNAGAGAEFSYCDTAPYPAGTTTTNFTFNPAFVDIGSRAGNNDYVAGDYRLQKSSLCIDAGTNLAWMTNGVDLDGNDRLYADGIVDIGAYELIPPQPTGTIILIP